MTKPDTCVPVDPTLAESLRQGEASSRAEGVDPNDSTVYLNIKRRLLAGEITLDEAHVILDDCFTEDDVVAQILPMLPRDDVWRGSDYDDEPRSNGNCGLDPFQQECENAIVPRAACRDVPAAATSVCGCSARCRIFADHQRSRNESLDKPPQKIHPPFLAQSPFRKIGLETFLTVACLR